MFERSGTDGARPRASMSDLVFAVVTVLFFALSWAYVKGIDRL
jgi:hypothetical protein